MDKPSGGWGALAAGPELRRIVETYHVSDPTHRARIKEVAQLLNLTKMVVDDGEDFGAFAAKALYILLKDPELSTKFAMLLGVKRT